MRAGAFAVAALQVLCARTSYRCASASNVKASGISSTLRI